jgi:lipopolysaccharide export system permease protein
MFQEMIGLLLTAMAVLIVVLIITKMIPLIELLLEKQISLTSVAMLTGYLLPFIGSYSLPMATLIASIMTMSRLSGDNELTALKASGVSLYQLLSPIVRLSIFTGALTAVLTIWLSPWGFVAFEDHLKQTAAARPEILLKAGAINHPSPAVSIYVERIGPRGRLEGVIIFQRRQGVLQRIVSAKHGRLRVRPRGVFALLRQGTIQVPHGEAPYKTIRFSRLTMPVMSGAQAKQLRALRGEKLPREMILVDLFQALQRTTPGTARYFRYQIELHQRLALPLACLIMGLLGVPLGVQIRGSSRSTGLLMAVLVFVVYYALMSAGFAFGKRGHIPPMVGAYGPNLIFALLAVYLIRQTARDRQGFLAKGLNMIVRLVTALGPRRARRFR